ncbi:MAG: aminopeptidase [Thermoprotei archaeon]|nr:MAG: aminopeptidase [Thermoprotei archaeon]
MIAPEPVRKLADLLVEYSLGVEPGWEVSFNATPEALPLAVEVMRAVSSRGAHLLVFMRDEVLTETYYRYATDELLKSVSKVDRFLMENLDAMISVVSSTHTKYLASIDPERLKISSMARRELTETFMKRSAEGSLKWVVSAYPTKALAQEANMSFMDYAEFVFRALKVDKPDPISEWKMQAEWQEKIANFLNKVSELRYEGPGLDLTVRVEGRRWINDDGKHNMPGGEVFTAPIEDSVEGVIEFTYPAVWRGKEVEGVRLVFKRGVVVEAKAVRGEEFLKKMLETDEGAKRVGELAFGLNYGVDRFTKSILFDEKIGGTIHLALGAAYPECGGENKSAIHWDMVRDMKGSRVYADGDLIYENGKFLEDVI